MCSCICLEWYQKNTTWLKDPGVILHHVVIAQMLKYQNHSSDWMRPEAIWMGKNREPGTNLPQRDLTYIFEILIFDQQFPREDLVKIW